MFFVLAFFTATFVQEQDNIAMVMKEPFFEALPIVILPENPPEDAYEQVKDLYVGWYEGEEVCILEFQPIELPENHPFDHDGYPLMLDSDGMTLLPQQDIVDGIDQRNCSWK
jgi:hypothetical protein